MNSKLTWRQAVALTVMCLFLLSPGISLLYGQDTNPEKQKDKQKDKPKQEEKKQDNQKEEEQANEKNKKQNKKTQSTKSKLKIVMKNGQLVITDEHGVVYDPTKPPRQKKYNFEQEQKKILDSFKPKTKKVNKNKNYWRRRKADLDKRIEDTEQKIESMQKSLNEKRSQLLIEDRPIEEQKLKQEIARLTASIASYKRGLADLKQRREALKDEARRAGVPPGWLR
jgi:chromosome segregation ATPase